MMDQQTTHRGPGLSQCNGPPHTCEELGRKYLKEGILASVAATTDPFHASVHQTDPAPCEPMSCPRCNLVYIRRFTRPQSSVQPGWASEPFPRGIGVPTNDRPGIDALQVVVLLKNRVFLGPL